MTDDIGTAADPGVVTALGHEVYQIDTRMAGYPGITAGYLIRSDRPCLVETGTAPSAPVVRDALAALGVGAGDLRPVPADGERADGLRRRAGRPLRRARPYLG